MLNIFLCDLFLLINDADIASYAYENNLYVAGDNIDQVISASESAATLFFNSASVLLNFFMN